MKLTEFALYYPMLASDLQDYKDHHANEFELKVFFWFYPTRDNKSIFRGGCTNLIREWADGCYAFLDSRSMEILFTVPYAFGKIPRKIYKQSITSAVHF